jgi:predicted PurR-regulated permease PerM
MLYLGTYSTSYFGVQRRHASRPGNRSPSLFVRFAFLLLLSLLLLAVLVLFSFIIIPFPVAFLLLFFFSSLILRSDTRTLNARQWRSTSTGRR